MSVGQVSGGGSGSLAGVSACTMEAQAWEEMWRAFFVHSATLVLQDRVPEEQWRQGRPDITGKWSPQSVQGQFSTDFGLEEDSLFVVRALESWQSEKNSSELHVDVMSVGGDSRSGPELLERWSFRHAHFAPDSPSVDRELRSVYRKLVILTRCIRSKLRGMLCHRLLRDCTSASTFALDVDIRHREPEHSIKGPTDVFSFGVVESMYGRVEAEVRFKTQCDSKNRRLQSQVIETYFGESSGKGGARTVPIPASSSLPVTTSTSLPPRRAIPGGKQVHIEASEGDSGGSGSSGFSHWKGRPRAYSVPSKGASGRVAAVQAEETASLSSSFSGLGGGASSLENPAFAGSFQQSDFAVSYSFSEVPRFMQDMALRGESTPPDKASRAGDSPEESSPPETSTLAPQRNPLVNTFESPHKAGASGSARQNSLKSKSSRDLEDAFMLSPNIPSQEEEEELFFTMSDEEDMGAFAMEKNSEIAESPSEPTENSEAVLLSLHTEASQATLSSNLKFHGIEELKSDLNQLVSRFDPSSFTNPETSSGKPR